MKYKKIKTALIAAAAIGMIGGVLYSQFGTKKSYDYTDYYVETKPTKNKYREQGSF